MEVRPILLRNGQTQFNVEHRIDTVVPGREVIARLDAVGDPGAAGATYDNAPE